MIRRGPAGHGWLLVGRVPGVPLVRCGDLDPPRATFDASLRETPPRARPQQTSRRPKQTSRRDGTNVALTRLAVPDPGAKSELALVVPVTGQTRDKKSGIAKMPIDIQ
jgi:hypothetical protein